jgi:hypothetical protein
MLLLVVMTRALIQRVPAVYILTSVTLCTVYVQIDFSEEAGRNRLITLLKSLLANLEMPSDFVEASMRALAAANPSKVLHHTYSMHTRYKHV